MHMLQRHREILHDFQQEYNKNKAALKLATERSELLSSVREDIREHRSAANRTAVTGRRLAWRPARGLCFGGLGADR